MNEEEMYNYPKSNETFSVDSENEDYMVLNLS